MDDYIVAIALTLCLIGGVGLVVAVVGLFCDGS